MDDLERQIDLISKVTEDRGVPKPPEPSVFENMPEGYVRCCCNRKIIPIQEVKHCQTGVVACTDSICDACLAGRPDYCKIVCIACQAVVARLQPHRDKSSGFEFKSGHFYHIPFCPNCKPGTVSAPMIEKQIFEKAKYKA